MFQVHVLVQQRGGELPTWQPQRPSGKDTAPYSYPTRAAAEKGMLLHCSDVVNPEKIKVVAV